MGGDGVFQTEAELAEVIVGVEGLRGGLFIGGEGRFTPARYFLAAHHGSARAKLPLRKRPSY